MDEEQCTTEYVQDCQTTYEQECTTVQDTTYDNQCTTIEEEKCEIQYMTKYEEQCTTVDQQVLYMKIMETTNTRYKKIAVTSLGFAIDRLTAYDAFIMLIVRCPSKAGHI